MTNANPKTRWGHYFYDGAAQLGNIAALVFAGALRSRRAPGELLRQLYQVGNRSLLFVLVTLGFTGMVLVFQKPTP